jgi:hypothetical protein
MSPLLPHEQAFLTGRWAEIIFRSLSTRIASRWRFVSFRGLGHGESRGIVDLVAIRKDMSQPRDVSLNRGDLFDIILVQMKGGSAPDPTIAERRRLKVVGKRYRAEAIVLFKWRRGVSSQFYVLDRQLHWKSASPISVFG